MQSEKIYTMKNYEKEPPFAGFLPGLSGIYGTPIWCYYVNRGQCISSFGVEDKDHAIIEFFPAHQAYQYTAQMGFRTFVKKDGKYLELFSDEGQTKEMHIKRNGLSITETNEQEKIACRVDYFTLPNERTGALVRKVGITNLSAENIELQVLDGLPQSFLTVLQWRILRKWDRRHRHGCRQKMLKRVCRFSGFVQA